SKIDRNSNYKQTVEGFQQRQMQILQSNSSEREIQSRLAELNKSFEMSKTPEIARFFKANEQFNKVMEKINQTIRDGINQEL
ncbi:MAG: YlbF family regulator, partial [Candidatus Bathyarchaeota archaeon]|nr:YlbF family regulator [Candidatus Bathyarchaeota archaeon]